ncbi:hypothetical protein P7G58_01000 [Globicatella sulfidifaciens]|uniref:hypothetical protein n=1 Tax=Globicatella sulfidifaciens TaxID=136093 RepID=UPI00288F409F|nr:hypothetical protein [Globicatella sulfidifaciens]MDT2767445.1 hypothetical protein [Globicatella sulfidifaciens]
MSRGNSGFKQIIKEETIRPTSRDSQQKQDEQHGFVQGADYLGRKKMVKQENTK